MSCTHSAGSTGTPQGRGKGFMDCNRQTAKFAVVALFALPTWAVAENKKEYRFNVGVKSTVSIINQYGP